MRRRRFCIPHFETLVFKKFWLQQSRIIMYQPARLRSLTREREQRKSSWVFFVPLKKIPRILTECLSSVATRAAQPYALFFFPSSIELMRMISQTRGYTVGYLYPMKEGNRRLVNFTSFIPVGIETFKKSRYVAVEAEFDAPGAIHDCLVSVGTEKYLVSGYYDPNRMPNDLLAKVARGSCWQGEISVLFVGKVIPFKQRGGVGCKKAVAR
jgi:hypothetical protein